MSDPILWFPRGRPPGDPEWSEEAVERLRAMGVFEADPDGNVALAVVVVRGEPWTFDRVVVRGPIILGNEIAGRVFR